MEELEQETVSSYENLFYNNTIFIFFVFTVDFSTGGAYFRPHVLNRTGSFFDILSKSTKYKIPNTEISIINITPTATPIFLFI